MSDSSLSRSGLEAAGAADADKERVGKQSGSESFQERLEMLFRKHYLPLRVHAQQVTGTLEEAEGVVQNVFAELWTRREALQMGYLKAYLYQAVRSRSLDVVRSARHRRTQAASRISSQVKNSGAGRDTFKESLQGTFLGRSSDEPSAREKLQAEELSEAIDRAVEAFPARRRKVYVMSRREYLSNAEIAEALGIERRTVEMHLWRALRSLREALAPMLPEGSPYLALLVSLSFPL